MKRRGWKKGRWIWRMGKLRERWLKRGGIRWECKLVPVLWRRIGVWGTAPRINLGTRRRWAVSRFIPEKQSWYPPDRKLKKRGSCVKIIWK
jgi:hypothetical protein